MNTPRTVLIEVGPHLAGYIEVAGFALAVVLTFRAVWAAVKFFSRDPPRV